MKQRIQYFLSSVYKDGNNDSFELVEEVLSEDLSSAPEGILEMFHIVSGHAPLKAHLYYKTDLPEKEAIVPKEISDTSANGPKCGWHDIDLYSVSYEDIEVLIDRQIDGKVEIRVWRNGKFEEFPFAKITFEPPIFVCGHCTRNDVESAECSECEFCVNCCIHSGSEEVEDPGREVTLTQVYESLEAAIDAVCDSDLQKAITVEYRKQIKLRYESDKESRSTVSENSIEPERRKQMIFKSTKTGGAIWELEV